MVHYEASLQIQNCVVRSSCQRQDVISPLIYLSVDCLLGESGLGISNKEVK